MKTSTLHFPAPRKIQLVCYRGLNTRSVNICVTILCLFSFSFSICYLQLCFITFSSSKKSRKKYSIFTHRWEWVVEWMATRLLWSYQMHFRHYGRAINYCCLANSWRNRLIYRAYPDPAAVKCNSFFIFAQRKMPCLAPRNICDVLYCVCWAK